MVSFFFHTALVHAYIARVPCSCSFRVVCVLVQDVHVHVHVHFFFAHFHARVHLLAPTDDGFKNSRNQQPAKNNLWVATKAKIATFFLYCNAKRFYLACKIP
jgi:hypothetical protein